MLGLPVHIQLSNQFIMLTSYYLNISINFESEAYIIWVGNNFFIMFFARVLSCLNFTSYSHLIHFAVNVPQSQLNG